MPIYEYRCENGHSFEELHSVDAPAPACPQCGAKAERQLSAFAPRFIGPGFHNTDYGKGKQGSEKRKD